MPSLPDLSRLLKSQYKPFALQGAFLATLYFGAKQIQSSMKVVPHHIVAAYPEVCRNQVLCDSMNRIASLENDSGTTFLLERLRKLISLSSSKDPNAQSEMASIMAEVNSTANKIVNSAPAYKSDDFFQNVVLCKEESLSNLEGVMDDILHNHLLDRLN